MTYVAQKTRFFVLDTVSLHYEEKMREVMRRTDMTTNPLHEELLFRRFGKYVPIIPMNIGANWNGNGPTRRNS